MNKSVQVWPDFHSILQTWSFLLMWFNPGFLLSLWVTRGPLNAFFSHITWNHVTFYFLHSQTLYIWMKKQKFPWASATGDEQSTQSWKGIRVHWFKCIVLCSNCSYLWYYWFLFIRNHLFELKPQKYLIIERSLYFSYKKMS